MNTSFYTMTQVCTALNLKKGRVRDWIVNGFIKSLSPSQGQGKDYIFQITDIYCLGVFLYLIENQKLSRELAGEMVNKSHWFFPRNPEKVMYIAFYFENKRIVPINYESAKELAAAMGGNINPDAVIIINFRKIKIRIDKSFSNIGV